MLSSFDAVPANLELKGAEASGEAGREWRRLLPDTVARLTDAWSLTIKAPFSGLSVNYAAPALRDDHTQSVLKVCSPKNDGFLVEVETLRLYDGQGAVRLLEVDLAERAMLLERAEPGTNLRSVEDESAQIEIAASIMKRLWRPPPRESSIPRAASEFERMANAVPQLAGSDFPILWVSSAMDIFKALDDDGENVVLHEDLHQSNILAAQREPWLAIDPHGQVGPAVLDTSQLILNFVWPEADRLQRRRKIAWCAKALGDALNLDTEQIRLCGLARSVIEAFWTWEEKGAGWERDLALVEDFAAAGN